ncbi:uncharacterized protein EI90DRAFT_3056118 [Cantharellus anzutake]|uniref:uncharacterized protein n=1 Tax=Cantharellus anzutake TaxID=1750568 RepID=UPI001905649C|nr:uncharacterized protein EI90DRAFT_3056118 [Cantharellus anzutake]KAF8331976.1 hypothetical protein EI90DRAFT_3056118 [Cantharellus anzutake]
MSPIHSASSSFSSDINVDVRPTSTNLTLPHSFPLKLARSDHDLTHDAPFTLEEGDRTKDTLTVRAEDDPPVGVSVAEGCIIQDVHVATAPFDLLAFILPSAFTTYSADIFLRNLEGSLHAQETKIVTVKRLVKQNAVRHWYLVLLLTRDGIPDFGVRVDRFRDHTLSLLQFVLRRGKSDAVDTVTLSGDTHLLYDGRSKEEATLELPQPVSFLDFMRILGVVLDECNSYSLFGENCRFVTSILEEILVDTFGARYATGEAAHLRFARKTRARIRDRFRLGENV